MGSEREQIELVEAAKLALDFAVKVNALITPLKSEWQQEGMWTDYDESVFQMRPKVTLALQSALDAQGDHLPTERTDK